MKGFFTIIYSKKEFDPEKSFGLIFFLITLTLSGISLRSVSENKISYLLNSDHPVCVSLNEFSERSPEPKLRERHCRMSVCVFICTYIHICMCNCMRVYTHTYMIYYIYV